MYMNMEDAWRQIRNIPPAIGLTHSLPFLLRMRA